MKKIIFALLTLTVVTFFSCKAQKKSTPNYSSAKELNQRS